jgi:hypothetical protein
MFNLLVGALLEGSLAQVIPAVNPFDVLKGLLLESPAL